MLDVRNKFRNIDISFDIDSWTSAALKSLKACLHLQFPCDFLRNGQVRNHAHETFVINSLVQFYQKEKIVLETTANIENVHKP